MKNVLIVFIIALSSFCFGQRNLWIPVDTGTCGEVQLEYDDYFHSVLFQYAQPLDTVFGSGYVEYATQRVHYCNTDSTKMLYLVTEVDQGEPELCICTDAELQCIAVHRTGPDSLSFKLVDWNVSIHEEKHDRLVKKMSKAYQNWERNAKSKAFQKKAFTFQKCDQFIKNSSR